MKHYDKILFIGPRSRGGMDAVLEAYQAMMPGARFVTTYRGGSKVSKIVDFARGYARAAWLLMRHPEIEIVHIHSASGASFRRKMMMARLAKRLGRKVVMHIHGGGFRDFMATDPSGISAALGSCDAVVCLTDQWRDFFLSQGVENVSVVPNPVDYPEAVERDDSDGKVHFLFLGVLDKAKGVVDLVEAVAQLPAEVRARMALHIGGTGHEEEHLRALIDQYSLADNIILEGWVTGEDKEALLRMCHCYVLPSYYEGLPVSILEAMAYGMAVIASRVGGIPSVVADGVNGILITPGDIETLARAMEAIVLQPGLKESMGASSRAKAEKYSPGQVFDTILKIYSRYGVNI